MQTTESNLEAYKPIYDSIARQMHEILDVFTEQFGADNVDCNFKTWDEFADDLSKNLVINPNITVWFPKVKVTNEFGKSIKIQDLYVKTTIRNNAGTLELDSVTMIRSTFPYNQFKAGYVHSHLPSWNINCPEEWKAPCFGNGPIRNTINTLQHSYNRDIWGLYVYELSKYVTVESVKGGPYRTLDSVNRGNIDYRYSNLKLNMDSQYFTEKGLFDKFIVHYAKNNGFKVKYVNNQYQLGEDTVTACIKMSNAFIEWYNNYVCDFSYYGNVIPTPNKLMENQKLVECIISGNSICKFKSTSDQDIQKAVDLNNAKKQLFEFKGKPVFLKITDIYDSTDAATGKSLVLSKPIYEYIISVILNIINYKYSKRNGKPRQDIAEQEEPGEKLHFV